GRLPGEREAVTGAGDRRSPPIRLAVAAIAAAFLATSGLHAQTAAQPWSCYAASAAAGPLFRTVQSAPACRAATAPRPWPRGARLRAAAEPLVLPSAPIGLAATVSGATVVLTWLAPATGGAPTSYVLQAGSASGLADLANSD